MPLKHIARKAKVGHKVLRDDGLLHFVILWVRFTEKTLLKFSKEKQNTLKHLIDTRVKYDAALEADFSKVRSKWSGTSAKKLRFNWIMSPPGKGSGGHMNVFRFIKFLEDAGHDCRIYIYTQHAPGRISDVHNLMGDSYPKLRATMSWINTGDEMPNADGIFATSWETAYASFNAKLAGKRFYFVQDFEPYFYALGSLYVLAENTYKMGFHGITAGGWLSTKLARDYGMQTDHFDFGSDNHLYSYQNSEQRQEIFCYVRPNTERRGFELAIMALDLFHQQHPDYQINLAGWDVSIYNIPFPYTNLKTLELSELNAVYNRCAAGLVISLTNMSLLPLELLGSGTIPVVNDGENNRLVSDNQYIAYSANDPRSLASTLSQVVSRRDQAKYAKAASQSVSNISWQKSGDTFIDVVESATRSKES